MYSGDEFRIDTKLQSRAINYIKLYLALQQLFIETMEVFK